MPRELKGMRFGLLKAVERTDRHEDGYFVWRCECECGGEAFVNTKRLLRGTVTPVSYTHLDVYKRQVYQYVEPPGCVRSYERDPGE